MRLMAQGLGANVEAVAAAVVVELQARWEELAVPEAEAVVVVVAAVAVGLVGRLDLRRGWILG